MTAFVPLVWSFAKDRVAAGLFIFMYYLLAARGIPAGGAVFFGQDTPFLFSVLLWIAASAALALPWILFWVKDSKLWAAFLRLTLIFIFISAPPIGLFGWASPLLAVGILLPGSRWLGLLVFLSVISLLKNAGTEKHRRLYYVVVAAMVILAAVIPHPKAKRPEGIIGIDTHYGRVASGSARFTDAFIRTSDIAARTLSEESAYVLAPETVAGVWTLASKNFWSGLATLLERRRQTLIVGAEIYDQAGKYDNCMIFLGFDAGKVYRQRVPVPVSMWRPFGAPGTANAYWFDPGIVELADGRRAAVLICYEQFIVWPVFLSFFARPDVLITTANQWWCRDTSIPMIQLQCAEAWAKLFGVPLITATNR